MGLDIALGCAVVWMLWMLFQLNTYTVLATIWYKMTPVVVIIALLVLRALERGFIVNTGGM